MKSTTVILLLFQYVILPAATAPVSAKPTLPLFPDFADQLKELKKFHLFSNSEESSELKKRLVRQSSFQSALIQTMQQQFGQGLAGIDPNDPSALIQLQVLAFLFTNTVQSVSGSISSASTSTSSAANKVGN